MVVTGAGRCGQRGLFLGHIGEMQGKGLGVVVTNHAVYCTYTLDIKSV